MGVIWIADISNREYKRLSAYAESSEKIVIWLEPLKMSSEPDWNPQWEEWHCYYDPLVIPLSDFKCLLYPYFNKVYPTYDAFDGTLNESFDFCFDNWICKKDWEIIASAVRADLSNFSKPERGFYTTFLEWLDEALKHTSIIVAEGNL